MKKLRLSVDERTLRLARQVARERGHSLNELIRDFLEGLAVTRDRRRAVEELKKLWAEGGGHSAGRKISRDEAYEARR